MAYDPLIEVIDEPLTIDPTIVEQLRKFRDEPKLANFPGDNTIEERLRLSKVLDDLVDRIISGIEGHPTKLWVLTEFQYSLALVEQEDTEGREHFGMELEPCRAASKTKCNTLCCKVLPCQKSTPI